MIPEDEASPSPSLFALLARAIPAAAPTEVSPSAAPVLTAATIYRAIEKVNAGVTPTVCLGRDTHVVHPVHAERGGWGICGQCLAPVYVPTP